MRPLSLAAVRALLCAALATVLLASCASAGGGADGDTGPAGAASEAAGGKKPNIIYVLTDDLSSNLVRYMPHVKEMQEQGTTFTNYYVTDSLCCPSRTSTLTGQYPHNSGVFTNSGEDGGYKAFLKNGNDRRSFGTELQQAGYRTGFMGKYLNGYQPADKDVPPGWDEWAVAGNGYQGFDYDLNENGKVVHYGNEPKDYMTDVLSGKAEEFIDASAKADQPFALELSTFTPHGPSTPAPRDKGKFRGLKAPRTEAFDKATADAPEWLRKMPPLTAEEKQRMDRTFAKRARSLLAVDAMIGKLRDELKAKGMDDDTYLVFGSDNGFHMGEHRLRQGKQTAYDTDIKVPLIITGPDVPAGRKVSQIAENVDLSPTFQDLAGAEPASTVDGSSLVDLLHGKEPDDWRRAALIEHHRADAGQRKGDPDKPRKFSGDPPDYAAMRTADYLYVEYGTGEREFYDMKSDPLQLKNAWDSVPEEKRAQLHEDLAAMQKCEGSKSCRKAAQPG
ncbi:sulfatase [Streptomyces sp. A7024]|uniref:Sulfatase n=1 Tax=Streptomyces coryli TaxID=1128680 RepID=A0A6G4TZM5_9ACTN|nr:sulfatase [Streptomyces coryli]NGN64578.1 sulfatase [Streptomyces coryli]